MELRYLSIQDIVNLQDIEVSYCPSAENLSDILTKALSTQEQNHAVILNSLAALQ